MKDALRAAGLPVARHKLITSEADARAFAAQVGFPMVLKPPAGMGAKATFRVSSAEELLHAVSGMRVGPSSPVLAEEMLRGSEHSFETITIGGVPRVCVDLELPARVPRGPREPVDPVGLRAPARDGHASLRARAARSASPRSRRSASRTA